MIGLKAFFPKLNQIELGENKNAQVLIEALVRIPAPLFTLHCTLHHVHQSVFAFL